jgi:hypothetical protein
MRSVIGGTTSGKSGGYNSNGLSHSNPRSRNRIPLQSFNGANRDEATTNVIGGRSLNESEENIVTKSGIMRTTDVQVDIAQDHRSDDSLKDLEIGR